jgi:glycerol-3-phosphate dehydrogenase
MSLRASSSPADPYDLAVIGGGINGAGIARDAAGRGLSVVLFEKGDLGSGTSANSTKLIHVACAIWNITNSAWCVKH